MICRVLLGLQKPELWNAFPTRDTRMSVSIRNASDGDVPLLAQMNRRLIEDEGSRNPMPLRELERRMRGWLQSGWDADVFVESRAVPEKHAGTEGIILGYAVYQHRTDEYNPHEPVIYLRQFFIDRPHRSKGLGTLALKTLFATRFPSRCTVVVDVLAANPRGLRFWERVGFHPHMTTLKAKVGTSRAIRRDRGSSGRAVCLEGPER